MSTANPTGGKLPPFSATVWPLTFAVCRGRRVIRQRSLRWLLAQAFPAESSYAKYVGVSGFERAWRTATAHTLLDIFRLANIARLVDASIDRPGDVFECGVAEGGTSLMIALLLEQRNSDKKLWLFDSFEGLPEPDRRHDRAYQKGWFAHSLQSVRGLMARHGVLDRCVFHQGWFSETLPKIPHDQTFCFGHIDCDLYQPARECIAEMFPKLSPGGALVFDDYYDGSGGVFKAVNDAARAAGELVWLAPSCQAFLVKGSHARAAFPIGGDGADGALRISFDALREQSYYSAFLDAALSASQSWRARCLAPLMPFIRSVSTVEFRESVRAFQRLMVPGEIRAADLALLGP